MNIYTKKLISETTNLTGSDLELETIVDLSDARDETLGAIALEFIGSGTVNVSYSSTLTNGDSTWKDLGTITLISDIRQLLYFPIDEPNFGRYYKFKVNGAGASIDELTFGMV